MHPSPLTSSSPILIMNSGHLTSHRIGGTSFLGIGAADLSSTAGGVSDSALAASEGAGKIWTPDSVNVGRIISLTVLASISELNNFLGPRRQTPLPVAAVSSYAAQV